MSNIEVVGLGALNIDHLYQVERILGDGEAVVNETTSSPGGSAANTIYGLARLGVNTGFAGVVGDDAEGMILVRDFQAIGVDTIQIRVRPGAKTGSVLCLSDRLGKRSLYVTPGANNRLTMDDLNAAYINQANILHLSSFADDRQFKILLELIDRLDSSTKLSFAPGALYASKGLKGLAPILKRTYVLFLNEAEVNQLTGKDVVDGAAICLEQGCHIVVVTLGRRRTSGKGIRLAVPTESGTKRVMVPAYIRDAEGEYAFPSSQSRASVVDATGAGDAFTAGFLYGLLKGQGLSQCGCLSDIVARFSMAKPGARQGLPSLDELARRYRELYNQEL